VRRERISGEEISTAAAPRGMPAAKKGIRRTVGGEDGVFSSG